MLARECFYSQRRFLALDAGVGAVGVEGLWDAVHGSDSCHEMSGKFPQSDSLLFVEVWGIFR